jgi:hemerythrin-like domain-containing protein
MEFTRRKFITSGALAVGTGLVTLGLPRIAFSEEKEGQGKVGVEEVSPVEDLMREHGGLNRILLIYDEGLRRIRLKKDFDPAWLGKSAKLIQSFIEGYHEKLEEEHLFPRVKKAGKFSALVDTLLAQHQAGRKLTATILALSTRPHLKNASAARTLESALTRFNRMYRPHEAREDTVLFPEFKTLLTQKEYDKLGDQFEDKEHELFGKEGFEGIVVQIAEIEKALGIFDLSNFTPKV